MDRIPNGVEYCLNSNPLIADDLNDWTYGHQPRRGGTFFSASASGQMPTDVLFAAEVLDSGGGWIQVARQVDG